MAQKTSVISTVFLAVLGSAATVAGPAQPTFAQCAGTVSAGVLPVAGADAVPVATGALFCTAVPVTPLVVTIQNAEQHLSRGYQMYWSGDRLCALQEFRAVTAADPDNAIAWYYRALSELAACDAAGAQASLQNAAATEMRVGSSLAVSQSLARLQGPLRYWVEETRQLAPPVKAPPVPMVAPAVPPVPVPAAPAPGAPAPGAPAPGAPVPAAPAPGAPAPGAPAPGAPVPPPARRVSRPQLRAGDIKCPRQSYTTKRSSRLSVRRPTPADGQPFQGQGTERLFSTPPHPQDSVGV
jgi:hypothetical protein